MKYVSTRGHSAAQSFTDILLEGLGADGGLMVPEQWPRITRHKLDAMRDLAYPALAFEILADNATHPDPFVRVELVGALAHASGPSGMAGGQMMDLEATKASFDLPTVTRLQAMKTGALIGCAVESGAILGRLPPEGRTGLRGYARDLGLAFQIADDILDAEGDEALAGKKLRKDAAAGKETFLTLLGLDRAREQARLLVDQAVAHLKPYGPEADLLRDLARYTLERDR